MRLITSLAFAIASVLTPFLSSAQQAYFNGELIVQTRAGADLKQVLSACPPTWGVRAAQELSPTMRAWLITYDTLAVAHTEVFATLGRQQGLSVVQHNHRVWLRAVPNDPTFTSQWHHRNTGQSGGTPDADIDADEAWEHTTGGTTALGDEIVVCIIEGVNMTHPDLIDNRWQNSGETAGNSVDDDGNGYIDDLYGWDVASNTGNVTTGGHGTNVAGMIGAKGNNSLGVAGINWNVKIMVVSGYNINSEANIISCYNYPLVQRQLYDATNGEKGAFVVATNASWGIDGGDPNDTPIWCAFYDTLGTYGILSCGATTNSNLNVDVSGDVPTACASPYMVGVGRSDRNDGFAGGYGATTIDFAAPGISVTTTDGTNGYTSTTGTSFSSPLTAGAIALLYSVPCEGFAQLVKADPQAGSDMVLDALLSGVDVRPALIGNFITGGRLNVNNSLNHIFENYCPTCLAPLALTNGDIENGEAELNWARVSAAQNYTLYYRETGTDQWLTQQTTDTLFSLTGLDNCGQYEFYVESVCPDGVSTPSSTRTFSVMPYCETAGTAPSAGFSVLAPSTIAGSYTFQAPSAWGGNWQSGTVYGNLVVVNDGSANPTQGCQPLVNAAAVNGRIAVIDRGTCEFGIKALNAQNAGATAVIIVNNAAGTIDMGAGAQGGSVTIPVIMVSQANGNTIKTQITGGSTVMGILGVRNEWLQNVTVGAFSLTSGNDGGYAFHRQQGDLSLLQGSSENVSITAAAAGNAALPQRVRVWLDADQNGTFATNELVFDATGNASTAVTGTLSVPMNALVGNTRLRVQTTGSISSLPDVCGAYSLGETEDYCVSISPLAVSIAEEERMPLSLVPNPSSGQAIIGGLQAGQVLSVFAADGRIVLQSTAQGQQFTLNTAAWSKGTYVVQVVDGQQGLRHTRLTVM